MMYIKSNENIIIIYREREADLHLEPFLETNRGKKKLDQVLSVHLEPPNQSTLRTKSRFPILSCFF